MVINFACKVFGCVFFGNFFITLNIKLGYANIQVAKFYSILLSQNIYLCSMYQCHSAEGTGRGTDGLSHP